MSSSIEKIIQNNIDLSKKFVVALSGGVDSSVLAHVLSKTTKDIRLMFVQHNQAHSKELEETSKKIAKSLHLDLKIIKTSLKPDSSETEMREERYISLLSNLENDEILLTGHNLSDKAETLLINLFRGTRLEGLKSIAPNSLLSTKPMINISKKEIYDYANLNNILYLDDPTNNDNKIVRNWIRNNLIPEINDRFPGTFELKADRLSNEVEFRSNYDKQNIKYLKKSEGYLEVPILLLSSDRWDRQFYFNEIGKFVGLNTFQKKDLEKIEKVLNENVKVKFFKDWTCFKSGGSILFINRDKWIIDDTSNFKSYGFFNFKKIKSVDIFNKWMIALPEKGHVSLKIFQNGEKIISGRNSIKVTEIFRNYGIDSELRNIWPIVYLDEDPYWVVGLRKSDLAIENEKKYNSNIIVASTEKSSIEN